METILTALENFGIGGLFAGALIWFMWYRETKTIPALMEQVSRELQAERALCQRWHEENLKDHQALMEGQKEIHHAVQELQQHLRLDQALMEQRQQPRP
jgi:hypothetical protein